MYLGVNIDCSFIGMAYLNTNEAVYSKMDALALNGKNRKIVMNIKVRHIFFIGNKPRIKYLLDLIKESNVEMKIIPKTKRKNQKIKPTTAEYSHAVWSFSVRC